MAPGYSMRSWRDTAASFQTPPKVSIVRTDTWRHLDLDWPASGQWLSASGVLQRERTFILYIVHPDTPKCEQAIREIMETYRKAFQQESVLRVRSPARLSF